MIHYIGTDINGEEVLFTGGSNHRTIRALAETGFDIYGLYNSWELHGGMSGTGEDTVVDFKVAKQAFFHAVGWFVAMRKHFPEKFEHWENNFLEYDLNISANVPFDYFSKPEILTLVEDKTKYYPELDEDTLERSFRMMHNVMNFTWRVYQHTKKGNTVSVFFV
ncbi:MAG: hypothetical protein K8R53_11740 [Bacteroidales bacterium]|nr:hypothetical protein [Bacteroidales bacterium]